MTKAVHSPTACVQGSSQQGEVQVRQRIQSQRQSYTQRSSLAAGTPSISMQLLQAMAGGTHSICLHWHAVQPQNAAKCSL